MLDFRSLSLYIFRSFILRLCYSISKKNKLKMNFRWVRQHKYLTVNGLLMMSIQSGINTRSIANVRHRCRARIKQQNWNCQAFWMTSLAISSALPTKLELTQRHWTFYSKIHKLNTHTHRQTRAAFKRTIFFYIDTIYFWRYFQFINKNKHSSFFCFRFVFFLRFSLPFQNIIIHNHQFSVCNATDCCMRCIRN